MGLTLGPVLGRLGGGATHTVIPEHYYTGYPAVHPVMTVTVPPGGRMLIAAQVRTRPTTDASGTPEWTIDGETVSRITSTSAGMMQVLTGGDHHLAISTSSTTAARSMTSIVDVYTAPL